MKPPRPVSGDTNRLVPRPARRTHRDATAAVITDTVPHGPPGFGYGTRMPGPFPCGANNRTVEVEGCEAEWVTAPHPGSRGLLMLDKPMLLFLTAIAAP